MSWVCVVVLVFLAEGGGAHLEVLAGESFLHLEQRQELLFQANGARHVLAFFGFVKPVDLLQLPVQVIEKNPVLLGMADWIHQSGLVECAEGLIVDVPVERILVPLIRHKVNKQALVFRDHRSN